MAAAVALRPAAHDDGRLLLVAVDAEPAQLPHGDGDAVALLEPQVADAVEAAGAAGVGGHGQHGQHGIGGAVAVEVGSSKAVAAIEADAPAVVRDAGPGPGQPVDDGALALAVLEETVDEDGAFGQGPRRQDGRRRRVVAVDRVLSRLVALSAGDPEGQQVVRGLDLDAGAGEHLQGRAHQRPGNQPPGHLDGHVLSHQRRQEQQRAEKLGAAGAADAHGTAVQGPSPDRRRQPAAGRLHAGAELLQPREQLVMGTPAQGVGEGCLEANRRQQRADAHQQAADGAGVAHVQEPGVRGPGAESSHPQAAPAGVHLLADPGAEKAQAAHEDAGVLGTGRVTDEALALGQRRRQQVAGRVVLRRRRAQGPAEELGIVDSRSQGDQNAPVRDS